ncbi:Arylsulfatase [Planctomycetes bacterium Pan216]|uniref:Arylsulfatase n=1 Tax=Kolteria novifilia TaxID=2527975 RepID=A0A518B3Q6_9BACT|nr:Arylsulfatase [Planctomycetes bacterium Pan216]
MKSLAITLLCSVIWFLAPTTTWAGEAKPNILLLVSDDQRPDTIGALGNDAIETPNLDRLVREGTSFTRAVCANPICTPSRAEILTGCDGFTNGTLDFGRKINPDLTTFPEAMVRDGYHAWYVGKWHNNDRPKDHGYEESRGLFGSGGGKWWKDQVDWKGRPITGYRGWIFQDDDRTKHPELGVGLTPNISSHFADAAIELIGREREKPFFLHVNFTAPHDPLIMPPGYADRYPPESMALPKNFLPRHPFDHGNFDGRDEQLLPWPRTKAGVKDELAMYYRVISHLDAQVGRILNELDRRGESDNTIVLYTSDHGLAVGSHGLRGKQNMYEHTIGVPLIVRGPGIPKGERRDAQVYLRDIYPTCCELTGAAIPASVNGRSFAAVFADKEKEIHPHVFGYFRDAQRMIRDDRWKLIHYPKIDRVQLFDLVHDPNELRDLSDDPRHAKTRARLKAQLHEWQHQVKDPVLAQTNATKD